MAFSAQDYPFSGTCIYYSFSGNINADKFVFGVFFSLSRILRVQTKVCFAGPQGALFYGNHSIFTILRFVFKLAVPLLSPRSNWTLPARCSSQFVNVLRDLVKNLHNIVHVALRPEKSDFTFHGKTFFSTGTDIIYNRQV